MHTNLSEYRFNKKIIIIFTSPQLIRRYANKQRGLTVAQQQQQQHVYVMNY